MRLYASCISFQLVVIAVMLTLVHSFSMRHLSRRAVSGLRRSQLFSTHRSTLSKDIYDGSIREILGHRIQKTAKDVFGHTIADPLHAVSISARPELADYMSNVAMSLAKSLGKQPKVVGEEIIRNLDVSDICLKPTIAGPGFINFQLSTQYMDQRLKHLVKDTERLGVKRVETPARVIVDFSSPNIAKEMHVGHLRSTIIGDSICRVLEFIGHDVSRVNHVGDWGTQFGMVLRYLKVEISDTEQWLKSATGQHLTDLYRSSKNKFDEDPAFQADAREEVTRLQSGDAETKRIWEQVCEASRRNFQAIYDILDVQLNERGESFYSPLLKPLVDELLMKGFAEESDGAVCMFVEGFKNRDGTPLPLIIQKSDGGYTYSTTDLAAIKYRCEVDKARRILYVTDAGQGSHFSQVFLAAKKANLVPQDVSLEHVPFGVVQGEDGKKLKTRSGEFIKLKDLLMDAVNAATTDMKLRYKEEGKPFDATAKSTAKTIGIAAVKYADLSLSRTSDYRFSHNRMLALHGNTAPYMLYAYARIKGIQRNELSSNQLPSEDIHVTVEAEVALAKQLLRLPEILHDVERELYPSRLCDYIFELSTKFNYFYEHCPVHRAGVCMK